MMWFARTATGIRVWFVVKQSSGALRTGLVAGDFFCSVANPADSASVTPAVTESTQRPGSYYFDISSVFLLANGVGYYSIVIVVDTFIGPSPPPNVRDSEGGTLYVSQQLWDQLATVAGVWGEALPGAYAAGSAGERLATTDDRVDVAVSTRAAPGAAMTLTVPAADALIDGVWDEALAGHLAPGTTGEALAAAAAGAGGLTPGQATQLNEIYRLLGLDLAFDVQHGETYIRVPADGSNINIQVTKVGTTTTLQRL